jgi:hypothetical protein
MTMTNGPGQGLLLDNLGLAAADAWHCTALHPGVVSKWNWGGVGWKQGEQAMEQETEQASQFLQVLLLTTTQPHLHTHTHTHTQREFSQASKAKQTGSRERNPK